MSSYGWAAASILELFGEARLALGWADLTLRRPVFTDDHLVTTATGEGVCEYVQRNVAGKETVVGRAPVGVDYRQWLSS